MEKTNLQDSPSFVDLCTLHQHAMRYYRLWIYACNTVLAVATLVFTVFAVSVLVDPRLSLLTGVELYQPTFLYAYAALFLQCGVLQTIGCLGALRLNQKLLNTYWTLLLVLMIGDIIVGLIWAFRLDGIKDNIRPNLKRRLEQEYGRDPSFTQVWDWLQAHEMCCGVDSPSDYNYTSSDPPDFIERMTDTSSHYESTSSTTSAPVVIKSLPSTCCTFITNVNLTQEEEDSRGSSSSSESKRSQNFPGDTSPMSNNQLNTNRNAIARRRNTSSRRQNLELKTDGGGDGGGRGGGGGGGGGAGGGGGGAGGLKNSYPSGPYGSGNQQSPHSQIYPHYLQQQQPPPQHTTESSSSLSGSQRHHHSTTNNINNGFQEVCEIPPNLLVSTGSDPNPDTDDNNNINNPNNLHISSTDASFKSSHSTNKHTKIDSNNVLKKPGGLNSEESTSSSSHWNSGNVRNFESSSTSKTLTGNPGPSSSSSSTSSSSRIPIHELLEQRRLRVRKHSEGCAKKVQEWLEHVTDILFVIGFCIIVFLKGCFLAILRYEIREMIQKIRLLNGEDALRSATMNELIGLTSIYASDPGSQGENEGGSGEGGGGSGNNPGRHSLDDSIGILSSASKRQSGGSGGDRGGGAGLLSNTADTSLSNCTKHHHHHHHHQPHMGNHVGGSSSRERQDNGVEDEDDSSSALLGRPENRARGSNKEPGAPRALPKNGNNNIATTSASTSAAATADQPSISSSAP